MSPLRTFLLFSFISFYYISSAQNPVNFTYKAFDKPPIKLDTSFNNEISHLKKQSYDLSKSLPGHFVRDGSVDYTSFLQAAIDRYDNVVFPDFPILINGKGLKLRSNMTLIFLSNSSLIMTPNDLKSYALLAIYDIHNVKIFNAKLKGDRIRHFGLLGEWGIGISIKGSTNILIVNPSISECWGDGIYIGQSKNVFCRNIRIYNAYLDYNRRNGISVISVDSLKIIDPVITNTFGAFPMAGIDFEPNNNNGLMDNIFVGNPVTYNSRYGILIALGHYSGEKDRSVNIMIDNHFDYYSNTALYISGFIKPMNQPHLTGSIIIDNPVWRYNDDPLVFRNTKTMQFAPNIQFNNIKIYRKEDNGNDLIQSDPLSKIINSLSTDKRVQFH